MLGPEDHYGYIEYKRTLSNMSSDKFISYCSQMIFRLKEGNNKCIYYIGVNDDGSIYGLDIPIDEITNIMNKISKKCNAQISSILIKDYFNKKYIKYDIVKDNNIPEHRIIILGDQNTGKSTFISNLLFDLIDDFNGKSKKYLLNNNSYINYYPIGINMSKMIINNYNNNDDLDQIKDNSDNIIYFVDINDTGAKSSIASCNLFKNTHKYTNNLIEIIKPSYLIIFIEELYDIKKYNNLISNNYNIIFFKRDDIVYDIILLDNIYNVYLYNNKIDNLIVKEFILKLIRNNIKEEKDDNNYLIILDVLYSFNQKKYLLLTHSNINDDILHKNITLKLEQDNIIAKIESVYWMGTTMDKISNNKTYTIIVNFDKNINRLRSKKLFIL